MPPRTFSRSYRTWRLALHAANVFDYAVEVAPIEPPTVSDSAALDERLRAAIEGLDLIAADWRLLDRLPPDERRRFHQIIAKLSEPDPRAKRKRQKAESSERPL